MREEFLKYVLNATYAVAHKVQSLCERDESGAGKTHVTSKTAGNATITGTNYTTACEQHTCSLFNKKLQRSLSLRCPLKVQGLDTCTRVCRSLIPTYGFKDSIVHCLTFLPVRIKSGDALASDGAYCWVNKLHVVRLFRGRHTQTCPMAPLRKLHPKWTQTGTYVCSSGMKIIALLFVVHILTISGRSQ